MPELTREMVRVAPQVTNAIRERELSLRGLHLTQLPLTDSRLWADIVRGFDHVDLSDNVLQWLDAPPLPQAAAAAAVANDSAVATSSSTAIRLTSIALHNNALRGISRVFAAEFSTTLHSLVLHNNFICELSDCNVFGLLRQLQRLSLRNNPVQKKPSYRVHVIGVCAPTLKLLDFNRVRDAERSEAAEYHQAAAKAAAAEAAAFAAATRVAAGGAGGGAAADLGGVGGGRRAARKAAAMATGGTSSTSAAAATTLEGKRPRGAAEAVASDLRSALSDRVGDAIAASRHPHVHPDDTDTATAGTAAVSTSSSAAATMLSVAARREKLMELLDAAASLEEMDRIEQQLAALGDA